VVETVVFCWGAELAEAICLIPFNRNVFYITGFVNVSRQSKATFTSAIIFDVCATNSIFKPKNR
jgi:N-acetylmuramoyl-L-alanine amidase CwlA